jgi:hypothetical protein
MEKLTRRGFIRYTSFGAGTAGVLIGVLAAKPRLAAHAVPRKVQARAQQVSAAPPGPTVAYIRDLATGEIGLLVGTREIIYRDPDLVRHLLKGAQQ